MVEAAAQSSAARQVGPLRRVAGSGSAIAFALLLLAVSCAIAYQLALARTPHHRATIEALLRAQVGMELRFSSLQFRIAWHGPEAVFTQVELYSPGGTGNWLRAQRLILTFDGLQTLSSGRLQPGRITLVGPQIDLTGTARSIAAPTARSRDTARSVDVNFLQRLFAALQRLPQGRTDLEAATVYVDSGRGTGSMALRVPVATLQRDSASARLSAYVQLPDRVGRSLSVVIRLARDDTGPDLSGQLRIRGRALAVHELAGWLPMRPYWPTAATMDVGADATVLGSEVRKLDGRVAMRDVVLADAADGEEIRHFGDLSFDVDFSRGEDGYRLRIEDLAIAHDGLAMPAANLSLQGTVGEPGFILSAPTLPVVALQLAALWQVGGEWLRSLDELGAVGELRDLRVVRGARDLAYSARIEDGVLRRLDDDASLSGLAGSVAGDANGGVIDLSSSGWRLHSAHLPQLSDRDIAVQAVMRWREDGRQIEFATEALSVQTGDSKLTGTLRGRWRDGSLQALTLRGSGAQIDAGQLPIWLPVSGAWQELAGLAGRIEAGKLARVELAADVARGGGSAQITVEPRINLQLADVRIAAGGGWPAVQGLSGRVDWQRDTLRLRADAGEFGGLEVRDLQLKFAAGEQRKATVTANLRGEAGRLAGFAGANPAMAPLADQLQRLDLSGPVDLNWRADSIDGDGLGSWRAGITFSRLQLRTARDWPELADLAGNILVEDGRLKRSRVRGRWLGGPMQMTLLPAQVGTQQSVAVEASGTTELAMLARHWGLAAAAPLRGSAQWRATLAPMPRLRGTTEPDWLLSATVADRAAAQLRFHANEQGRFALERAAVRFGADKVALPPLRALSLSGHLDRLDADQQLLAVAGHDWLGKLPLDARLSVAELRFLGNDYRNSLLQGNSEGDALHWTIANPALRGRVVVPQGRARAMRVELQALRLTDAATLGPLLAKWAQRDGQLEIDIADARVDDRALGHVVASLSADRRGLRVKDFRVTSGGNSARIEGLCATESASCSGRLQLAGDDLAAQLRSWNLPPVLAAAQYELSGDLTWDNPLQPLTAMPVGFEGQASLQNGRVSATSMALAELPALLRLPVLLVNDSRVPAQLAAALRDFSALRLRIARHDRQLELGEMQWTAAAVHAQFAATVDEHTGQIRAEGVTLPSSEVPPAPLRAAPTIAAAFAGIKRLLRTSPEHPLAWHLVIDEGAGASQWQVSRE
ncbi:MAG: DUF3971 domain-containing protein [Steroidobacteraceae bacterium]